MYLFLTKTNTNGLNILQELVFDSRSFFIKNKLNEALVKNYQSLAFRDLIVNFSQIEFEMMRSKLKIDLL